MNVACDYEASMQMLTTEKYIAPRPSHPLPIKCCAPCSNQFSINFFRPIGVAHYEQLVTAHYSSPCILTPVVVLFTELVFLRSQQSKQTFLFFIKVC